MKKFLVIFVLLIALIGCGGKKKEGIHLGIIGFNEELTTKKIGLLDYSSEDEYYNFIGSLEMKNATGLYYADYEALDMLRDYSAPSQLKKVVLVTFTDGLDNVSIEGDHNPGNFNSQDEYLNALNYTINQETIHGIPVEAYSIGLDSKDVTDKDKFHTTLKKLASNEDNVFPVNNMDEVKEKFKKIAQDLYSVSTTSSLTLEIPGGYDDGQKLRLTFDGRSAENSSRYIDATYRRQNNGITLENITSEGFVKTIPTIIESTSKVGLYYQFVFDNLQFEGNNSTLSEHDIAQIQLFKQTSRGEWDKETEFYPESSSEIIENQDSALIMLVLDCTTSLGEKFYQMQEAAMMFVGTLIASDNYGGNGGNGGNGGGDYGYDEDYDEEYDYSDSSYDYEDDWD